jgi:DNA polymerase-3 subunit delta
VIVLAGDEMFLRNQHLADIRKAVFGGGGDDLGMGLVRLDAGALGGDAMAIVLDEARTGSMFAAKKVVIVDPADPLLKKTDEEEEPPKKGGRPAPTRREMLENYVASPADSAVLVLAFSSWPKGTRLHKALDKVGAVRWCEPIKEFQAAGWVTRRAKEAYGKAMDGVAAARLAELIGPDLQRLDNELAKLALYEPDSPAITQKAVDALVGFQHEQKIWDMIDALASKDAPGALKKIHELWALDPKIEYMATGAVFSWVNQVIKAREMVDRRMPDAVIGKELKLWPPERAQKVLTMARSWGLAGAAKWSERMLAMDVANKSSLGEPRRNLEKWIVELCSV